jgi:hypothetical protein
MNDRLDGATKEDAGKPHPKGPPWPLPGVPTWIEFQERYAAIKPPVSLIHIYELVLAAAITSQLREDVRH